MHNLWRQDILGGKYRFCKWPFLALSWIRQWAWSFLSNPLSKASEKDFLEKSKITKIVGFRCVLTDATWLSGLLLCFLWLSLFVMVWYSPPSPSVAQIQKYQLSNPNQRMEQSLPLDSGPSDLTKRLEHFSYLPTKALPLPMQQRPSDDDTLYLPIHSNTTTTATTKATAVYNNCTSNIPLDEKVQVSDLWFQHFDPSIINESSSSKSSTYAHSMDLGWMRRMDHHGNSKWMDGGHDEMNTSIPATGSRRMVMAQSCPEFNKKRVKTLMTTLPIDSDDTPLHYWLDWIEWAGWMLANLVSHLFVLYILYLFTLVITYLHLLAHIDNKETN